MSAIETTAGSLALKLPAPGAGEKSGRRDGWNYNGDGTFGPFGVLPISGAFSLYSLVGGSFGGPTHLDLAALVGNEVVTFFGNGEGTFSSGGSGPWQDRATP